MGFGLSQSGNEYEMYTRETNITTEKTAAVDAVELNPAVSGTLANKVENLRNYSTEEKVVGTWINDKPLYEKTIVETITTVGAVTGSLIDVATVGVVFIEKSFFKWNNTFLSIPYFASNTDVYTTAIANSVHIYAIGSGYKYGFGSVFTGTKEVYTTIRYTKTTD